MSVLRDVEEWSDVHFIYNPQSGNRTIQRNVGVLAERLAERFPRAQVRIQPTAGPADATRYASQVAREIGRGALVVIAGGDGSVSEAANGVIGTETSLLVLPYGTGNDLARTLYRAGSQSPHDIMSALLAADGVVRVEPMDALHVTGENIRDTRGTIHDTLDYHSVNVISIGFDSEVAIVADNIHRRVPWLLGLSYPIGVLAKIFSDRSARLRQTWIDDEGEHSVERDYTLSAIGNASYYGGGFQPHPDARVNDGMMNIVTSRPVSIAEIAKLIGKFRVGERIDPSVATYEMASWMRIEGLSGDLVLTLDGEGFFASQIEVEAVPQALSVVLPASWNRPKAFWNYAQ